MSEPNAALVEQYGLEKAKQIADLVDQRSEINRQILALVGEQKSHWDWSTMELKE